MHLRMSENNKISSTYSQANDCERIGMQMRETGAIHKLCARNTPHQATVKLFRGSLRMLMNGKSPVWWTKGFTHSTKEIRTCCKKQKDHANALPRPPPGYTSLDRNNAM